jgi:putative transposase
MDTQKVTTEYRMSQWAQIIKERQSTGQKVDDFCEERGLSRHSYFYWLRKIRKAACTELAKISGPSTCSAEGWIQLSSPEQRKETISIEVNGCSVNADMDTDPELLKKVCYILRTL